MQRGLALAGDTRRGNLPLVERHQVFPALGLRVEPLQRSDRRRVQAEIEDLLVDPDGRARVAELLVGEARLFEEELLALRLALGRIGPALDHLEERGVARRLLVERLQRHQRAPVVAAQLQRPGVVLAAREPGRPAASARSRRCAG